MKQLQFRIHRYSFKPSFIGTVVALVCISLFIKFGLWQYHKAQHKQIIQTAYNQAKLDEAMKFPWAAKNIDDLNYKKVTVSGFYETKYQILLDNQVDGDRVGYHVITPLKIEHSSQYVLINRGWIPAKDIHTELPVFITPNGLQMVTGQIWVPSKKIFTLEKKEKLSTGAQPWQMVWQNMDINRYRRSVPIAVSDMAIKLDEKSDAGGFVRNWQMPAERIATNIGYAYQWFGFAFATLIIYIYMSLTSIKSEVGSGARKF